jgi:hypothetical protein
VRTAILLLATFAAACGSLGSSRGSSGSADASADAATKGPLDAGDDAMDAATFVDADASHAALPLPSFAGLRETCKLINATALGDPTPNGVQDRANIAGTDLGVPVNHQGTLFFFFGDTIGYKGIWQQGQSLPDAVGFADVPFASVAASPSILCTDLRFLTLSHASSIGPTVDPAIQADYAAGSMTAPDGGTLAQFIHNPAGNGSFPNLPGDFEVPSGAFSSGGSIYIFYTTVQSAQVVQMKASYLARWRTPATTGIPGYDILYAIDERFDTAGALAGDFVNIAAETFGAYVYLFGTGDYRKSPIHVARKRLDSLDAPGGIERYDAQTNTWTTQNTVAPIVADAVNGEVSVRYFPAIGRWMMLNQEESPTMNRVIAHFAERPEGPWSAPVVVADMADAAFRAQYCCGTSACTGEQLFHCDRAGFYGTYMLPDVRANADGSFVVSFTMSTWDPYNVALMEATFRVP